jgi:hypothetical protein
MRRRTESHLVPLTVGGQPTLLGAQAAAGDELVPASKDIVLSEDDVQQLREKYRIEREKRQTARPEGQAQYARLVDLAQNDERFARMLADPYPKRETVHPVTDDIEVCVVGTGYGGLCAGARLVEAGISPSDIRMIDKAGDVGGTWYWNRYPGAMCDVEAYVYMPLCEETGYVPTQKYAQQPEIYAHSQMVAEHYGLYEKACFNAQVTGTDIHYVHAGPPPSPAPLPCLKRLSVVLPYVCPEPVLVYQGVVLSSHLVSNNSSQRQSAMFRMFRINRHGVG